MAGWLPPLRDGRPGSAVRFGGRVLADRELVLLAERLGEIEDRLADRASAERLAEDRAARELREAAHARVERDLELLRAALGRAGLAAH